MSDTSRYRSDRVPADPPDRSTPATTTRLPADARPEPADPRARKYSSHAVFKSASSQDGAGDQERSATRHPSHAALKDQPPTKATAPPARLERYTSHEGLREGEASTELELEAPESADPEIFAEFRKLGLDAEKAKAVLGLDAKRFAAEDKRWQEQVAKWQTELEADPEITAGAERMRAMVRDFAGKEFLEALGDLGNHPAVVRGMVRIADALHLARQLGKKRGVPW